MIKLHVCIVFTGKYKVQVYDFSVKEYQPSAPGLGMLVEVKDPDDKIILSRVSQCPEWSVWYQKIKSQNSSVFIKARLKQNIHKQLFGSI